MGHPVLIDPIRVARIVMTSRKWIRVSRIYILLRCSLSSLQKSLEEWLERLGSSGGQFWREFLSETTAIASQLQTERDDFFHSSVQPLWKARGRLRANMERRRRRRGGRTGGGGGGGEGGREG